MPRSRNLAAKRENIMRHVTCTGDNNIDHSEQGGQAPSKQTSSRLSSRRRRLRQLSRFCLQVSTQLDCFHLLDHVFGLLCMMMMFSNIRIVKKVIHQPDIIV